MTSSLNVPNMRVCAMDLGTNSTRYMIADLDRASKRITVLFQGGMITRLGAGIGKGHGLAPEAAEKTMQAVRQFFSHALSLAVADFTFIGTAVLREAPEGNAFCAQISEETGYPVQIVDGGKEAQLLQEAVAFSLQLEDKEFMALDIGGGSAQILRHCPGGPASHVSLPLGAVRLTERFLINDPPTKDQMQALRDFTAQALKDVTLAQGSPAPLVGAGGAITTLAALAQGLKIYNHSKIHGCKVGAAVWKKQIEALAALSAAQRKDLPGMQKGREDIILAGLLVLDEIARQAGAQEITVSDRGVLYGLMVERLKEL